MNSKLNIFTLFLFSILLTACSGEKPTGKTAAESLYKEAKELVDSGRYILATDRLNTIKTNYPYSFYATHSELLLAEVLFKQENYAEAAAAFLLFRDMHPKHEKVPYVIWMIGESYYKQLPDTFDRDLAVAGEAMKYYSEVINRYQGSKYLEQAKVKIQKCQKMILKKELYIADFYYRTDVHQAARWRYLRILENGFSKKDRELAMVRIVETSHRMGEFEQCLSFYGRYQTAVEQTRKKKMQSTAVLCKNKTPYED
jgi:outer membrane protein assembly factor BamD